MNNKSLYKEIGMAFSVMFHHFHNNIHPKSQGSISGEQFENIIDWC